MDTADKIGEEDVKAEFYQSTEKFHLVTCWVGIVLNLIWFASDYFVLPDHWLVFLDWRIAVSSIGFLALILRKKLRLSINACVFVLALGISIQNSFMWSVMDLATMQKHTFAYIALFIGVGMLILWEFKYSFLLVIISVASNILFFKVNSKLTVEEFIINGALLTLSVAIFSMFLIRSRRRLTINEIRSRMELSKSKELIEKEHAIVIEQKKTISIQKEVVEEKNKEITDSINYAKGIQSALIPTEHEFIKHFTDCFVFFKPKDIVSGDFYWVFERGDKVFYATADCTGHGVPGGFMTMLGLTFLDDIVSAQAISEPAEILHSLREKIISTLKQTATTVENKDGMDITLCCLDRSSNSLKYASANNQLYVVSNGNLRKYEGDRQPCGFYHELNPFTNHEIKLQSGDCIYTCTDGYRDQFGGREGKRFKSKQFESMLGEIHDLPFSKQKQMVISKLDKWRGTLEQVDDVLLIGIKV